MMNRWLLRVVISLFSLFCTLAAFATTITTGGSTFIYPVMSQWSFAYAKHSHQQINYQPIGSSSGLNQFKQGILQFAASDIPLTQQKLTRIHSIQFPLLMGGVVIAIHVPGVANNRLRLDGATIAKIFLGRIKYWNNPLIQQQNPHQTLPKLPIVVIHRADGSGTTYNFSDYLSTVSRAWKKTIGSNTNLAWPTGLGAKGNSGVALYIKQFPGSIGYVEYSYAQQNHLTLIKIKNKSGYYVTACQQNFAAATRNTHWSSRNDFNTLIINPTGKHSWPINATTFVLLHVSKQANKYNTPILKFLNWCLQQGRAQAKQLNYIPLPKQLIKQVHHYWLLHHLTKQSSL